MPGAPKSPDSTWVSGLEALVPDDDQAPAPPEVRIGPYLLVEKLGEGGMGTVWVAEQTEPVRRRVALKVIKAGMDSELILQRFEAERHALALMDHRNIATVLDAGSSEARYRDARRRPPRNLARPEQPRGSLPGSGAVRQGEAALRGSGASPDAEARG